MQFRRLPFDPDSYAIMAEGPIVKGDVQGFLDFVRAQPPMDRVIGMILDSPGGDVIEAESLSIIVHKNNIRVFVGSNTKCVSACFLIFAASTRKRAADNALIGVHSVAENGAENADSMALTTAFARDLAGYGVPPAIIGKLVSTQPSRVEWLTQDDLRSMDVVIVSADASPSSTAPADAAPTPPAAITAMAPPIQVLPPSVIQPPQTLAFQQGLADRRDYENWFNGLNGEYPAGAFYWSGQRSLRNPGTCYTGTVAFSEGCLDAQRMLSPSDVRRHSEPDYRAGWNSF